MNVVVDASALGAVLFEEPEAEAVLAHISSDTLVAPELIDYEIANIALMKIRRGQQPEAVAIAMMGGLKFLGLRRLRVSPMEVIVLARSSGLSAYDAAYLWLAVSLDAKLVTLDRQLARADRALRGDSS
ncbi:MAG: type II toxin-antitoxin system VapC family toxin [Vicinamibacterales bacterium]